MQIGGDEKEEEKKKRIEERKKNALKYFKERLLKSEVGDLIAKIVLFGSVARGEAGEESDIDVLVFALGDLRKVREACADASLWTSIETGESVQPLVYCIDELRFPSFFIYKSVREGKVVFEMEREEMLRREAEGYLDLAETYFESFKMLKQANMYRVAVDVGYNAVELCIKALILLRAGEIPRTYGGIVKKFVDIMKTGEIPSEIGRKLHLSFENRNKASSHARITVEDADDVENLIKFLIGFLEREIRRAKACSRELREQKSV